MTARAQLTDPIGPIDQLTPEQRQQAARHTVAAHAHDTEDAAYLLAAPGLED